MTIKNCPKIRDFDVKENCLTDLNFLEYLNADELVWLNIQGNNFPEQDLSFLSNFINLERLMIKNRYVKEKFEKGEYNKFIGSLEPLKNLKKLKWINISNTDIDSGLEHLSDSVRKINCWNDWKQAGCSIIRRELENSTNVEGVTEKLHADEEGDPDPVRRSDKYYRLEPWRQAQEILLEKKPLVQKLKIQLISEQVKYSELQNQLKNKEDLISELTNKLGLAIKEEEDKKIKEKDDKIKELIEQLEREREEKRSLISASPTISVSNISNNLITNTNQNYQINYQLLYDEDLAKKELEKLKEEYQLLESNSSSNPSDPQKLKKSILFLAAKQIFANKRQGTINNLISTFDNLSKSTKKYDQINVINDYFGQIGEAVSFIPIPGIGTGIKLVNKGLSFLTDFLKNLSYDKSSKNFENYLIEDEKSLSLLQEIFNHLNNSLNDYSKINSLISQILNLNNDDFNNHSVFAIVKIQKNSQLKQEDIDNVINLLTNHLNEFNKLLKEDIVKYIPQIETLFTGEEGQKLQLELDQLLSKLVGEKEEIKANENVNYFQLKEEISQLQKELDELISFSKNKLKSRFLESKTKENYRLLEQFLSTGFIDSKLASVIKNKKVNLLEISSIQNSLKNLKEQLNELFSEKETMISMEQLEII